MPLACLPSDWMPAGIHFADVPRFGSTLYSTVERAVRAELKRGYDLAVPAVRGRASTTEVVNVLELCCPTVLSVNGTWFEGILADTIVYDQRAALGVGACLENQERGQHNASKV